MEQASQTFSSMMHTVSFALLCSRSVYYDKDNYKKLSAFFFFWIFVAFSSTARLIDLFHRYKYCALAPTVFNISESLFRLIDIGTNRIMESTICQMSQCFCLFFPPEFAFPEVRLLILLRRRSRERPFT
uniref:Ovule protein n=1 Tax=Ascaris lumbricoides TaxID=6252 RepID=A0A0M3IS20_ASCLU